MSTIATSISRKLFELETSNLVRGFVWGMQAGAKIIFPEIGHGHVTPTFLAYDQTYLQNYLS